MPCFKLGIRMGDDAFVKRFLDRAWTGFYVAVVREGSVSAGDPFELIAADPGRVPVA